MASFNQVTLIGNIGTIEVRTFQNGGKIVEASLATTERYKNQQGEYVDDTQWHRLILRGSNADFAERNVSKGASVFAQGRLTYRKYTTREGENRTQPEVQVFTFNLLDRRERTTAPDENPHLKELIDDLP